MTEAAPTDSTLTLLTSILEELRRQRAQDDDIWRADEIADYMKLSKKTVQCDVLNTPGFPSSVPLPTGGRRWVAKEIKAWFLHRRR